MICARCSEEKTTDDFYKQKDKSGNMICATPCKECRKAKVAEYRKKNPEKVKDSKQRSMAKKEEYYKQLKKDHYEKNKEEIIKKQKVYYRAHKDKKKEYDKRYRIENKERLKELGLKYYRENPEKFKSARLKRKSMVRAIEHTLTTDELKSILNRFDNKCALSGKEAEHIDHFIPVCTGKGGTTKENVIPLSAELNLSKGPKNPFEWVKEHGDIDISKFNDLVSYLAELNDMTNEDYKNYVYDCFKNITESIQDA